MYLRAMARRYVSRDGSDEAQSLLRQALRLDPSYIAAHGALAITHTFRFAQGWSRPGDTEEALRCARRVVEVGGHEPSALANAAHALAYLGRDYDAALAAAQRALLLAPNAAQILLACGWMRAYVGEADAALQLIERAKLLSPADPLTFIFNSAASYAHFVAGRYEQAVQTARRALGEGPTYLVAQRLLTTSLAHAGRVDEAAEAARVLLALAPGYTLAAAADHASMRDPGHATVVPGRVADGRHSGVTPGAAAAAPPAGGGISAKPRPYLASGRPIIGTTAGRRGSVCATVEAWL